MTIIAFRVVRPWLAAGLVAVIGAAVAPGMAMAEPCPTALRFDADAATSDVDFGWTGIAHDTSLIGVALTMGALCKPSNPIPCSSCDLSGPVPNAAGYNQRCLADTSLVCEADCGANGPCTFFLGPPQPIGVGGVPVCLVNQLGPTLSGTLNVPAGDFTSLRIPLTWNIYNGVANDHPCPICVGDPTPNDAVRGGTCNGGPRQTLSCDGNATTTSPDFGVTSFDCPPNPAGKIGTLAVASVPLASRSGGQSVTLSAASPSCSSFPFGSKKCACDTCDNANAEACQTNADCPLSGGNPGICGGRRCLGGTNHGSPCTSNSACPSGGLCARPGQSTQPNGCNDDTTTPLVDGSLCSDTAPVGDNKGECPEGPFDSFCAPPEQYQGCTSAANCPITGTCTGAFRRCYPEPGGTISVAGSPDPPLVDGTAHPTLGALYCLTPLASAAANNVAGFPGLGRLKLPGTLRLAQEIASRPVPPGGELSTGSTLTGNDPIETTVKSPMGGPVAIFEQTTVGSPPVGFSFVNQQVEITATPATQADPIVITFLVHYSRLTSVPGATCGAKKSAIVVQKDGVPAPPGIPACLNPGGLPYADPPTCIAERTCLQGDLVANSNLRITIWTTTASLWRFALPEATAATAVAGKKLQLKDDELATSKRKLVLQLRDENLVAPTPGDTNDPTCTGGGGGGAALDVFGTGGSVQYLGTTLPCSGWTVVGDPGDAKGYKYKDSHQLAGPCTTVVVKNPKVTPSKIVPGQIKATCSGKNPAQPLDYDLASGEGRVGVTFRMGTGLGYCAEFGGTLKKDDALTFQAQDASAPGLCPVQ